MSTDTSTPETADDATTGHHADNLPRVGHIVDDPVVDVSDDVAVVINVNPDEPAHDRDIPNSSDTVASYKRNRDYPDDSPIVEIAFCNKLQIEHFRDDFTTAAELKEHIRNGRWQVYPYPAARLQPTEEEPVITDPPEPISGINAADFL